MNKEVEIEVKFYVKELGFYENRLSVLGAECIHPRVHESNLRFDLPDRSLSQSYQVLRLRQDSRSIITYKGPAKQGVGVSERQEIEIEVSDFESARHILEALGYGVVVMYEKYRTTYQMDVVEVTLDEMPYGTFIEIEGPDASSIQVAAALLRLNWEARCTESYLSIFNRLKLNRNLEAKNLSFQELSGMIFTPEDLGLTLAG